jgi:hypothetical protein
MVKIEMSKIVLSICLINCYLLIISFCYFGIHILILKTCMEHSPKQSTFWVTKNTLINLNFERIEPDIVVHACNSSHLGGEDQKDYCLRTGQAKT